VQISRPGKGNRAAANLTGVASVIDGDTIDIHGTRIRLEGIDAPESRQTCIRDGRKERCGKQSAFHLSDRIGRRTVRCEGKGRDRYGRTLAICYLGSLDLNAMMVRDGHAVAYRRYSRRYVGEENEARKARRGIWATEFQMPWDWRRAR
jgi:endonuclease YncB( thermonuclease family)